MSRKSITASEFIEWIDRYNSSSLSNFSVPTHGTLSLANECRIIVSSNLQRSLDSAKALNSEKQILSDQLFVEAGLPSANYKLLKLPPNFWAVIFRFLWLLGYSNNSESFSEAKQRACEAAGELIHLARTHQKVLFVGHGILNRLIATELRNRGWSGPRNPGSEYWSFGVYNHREI